MKYEKYHNCLRLQITVDRNEDERISDLVTHCKKYGYDNVMLMLNGEEFHIGHITLEEAKPWVAVLKKAKIALEEKGISVSLNHWIEIGHLTRGRELKEGQNFTNLVDRNGKKEPLVACPLDKEWQKYFVELTKFFVQELQPDTYWIEDDFRLYNHGTHEGIGCFCEKHMKMYNAALGTNYTRAELVERILAKGKCNKERKVWLDVNRQTMQEAMQVIVDAVREVRPETDVAIMSSPPDTHCVEARDWTKLLDIMAGEKGHRINRIHLPQYFETSGKDYLYDFNRISMPMRAFSGNDCIIMPEFENGNISIYRKSPRYARFILEAATPLVLSGMTYSAYDFIGNGVRESLGYGQEVAKLQPYMQAIEDLQLKFSDLSGVVVPIDERASYQKTITDGEIYDLYPREYEIGSYLSAQGISYRYSLEKEFKEEIVFMSGSSMDYFTDEQIQKVFEDNFVIVDGSGALRLKERGLLSLVNAKDATLRKAETGYHDYEECIDGSIIDGVKNLRASCRAASGDFVEIAYIAPEEVYTRVFNRYMQAVAPAMVKTGNVFVLPYVMDKKLLTQFCDLRRHYLVETVKQNGLKCVISETVGISPYYYSGEKQKVLILVNPHVDTFPTVKIKANIGKIGEIFAMGKNGEKKEVSHKQIGDIIEIEHELEGLSSLTLIMK